MNRPLRLFFVFLALAVLTRPAACQNGDLRLLDLKEVLSGNSIPLTRTLKDLDGTWRTLSVSTASDAANPATAYLALSTGGSAPNTYYTQGSTVTLGTETYIVAYRPKSPKIDFAALMRGGANDLPKPAKMTPDTPLFLSLLNLRTLGTLSDIQPFLLEDELKSSAPAAGTGLGEAAGDTGQPSLSNLTQIGLAMTQYTQDNDEYLPSMQSAANAKKALLPYVHSHDVFQQPQTHAPYLPNTSLSGRSLASFENPATMVIYYEARPGPDGMRAVLFLDGHAKLIRESEWPALKAASHVPH